VDRRDYPHLVTTYIKYCQPSYLVRSWNISFNSANEEKLLDFIDEYHLARAVVVSGYSLANSFRRLRVITCMSDDTALLF